MLKHNTIKWVTAINLWNSDDTRQFDSTFMLQSLSCETVSHFSSLIPTWRIWNGNKQIITFSRFFFFYPQIQKTWKYLGLDSSLHKVNCCHKFLEVINSLFHWILYVFTVKIHLCLLSFSNTPPSLVLPNTQLTSQSMSLKMRL